MDEFTKLKITFSLALLAALFALSPILGAIGVKGFDIFGIDLQIRLTYFSFAALLGLAVYIYGIDLITEKSVPSIKKVANVTYALAIFIPPLYLALFLVVQVALLIGWLVRSAGAVVAIVSILGAVASVAGFALVVGSSAKGMIRRGIRSAVDQVSGQETPVLPRAMSLFQEEHYDLVLVECFRAIELSIRKALTLASVTFRPVMADMLSKARKHGVTNQQVSEQIDRIRRYRNEAVHSGQPVARELAREILDITGRVLLFLEAQEAHTRTAIDGLEAELWIGDRNGPRPISYMVSHGNMDQHIRIVNENYVAFSVALEAKIEGAGVTYKSGGTIWQAQQYVASAATLDIHVPLITDTRYERGNVIIETEIAVGRFTSDEPKSSVLRLLL